MRGESASTRLGIALFMVCGCVMGTLTTAQSAAALEPQIIGGQPAASGTWPSVAFIQLDAPDATEFCTGTVIAANVVLTAGHCAVDPNTLSVWSPSDYEVITGSVELGSGVMSGVSEVAAYPDFEYVTTSNGTIPDGDAALLRLSTPTSAPAMPLATPTTDASLYQAGTGAEIAGWGSIVGDEDANPDTLQFATTVVQNQSSCENFANEEFDAPFDAVDQMCAIYAPYYDEGTCHGDSGGPLVAEDSTGTIVEIGITSWSQTDCDTSDPDYFTNVAALSGWISDEITEMSPPTVTTSPATSVGQSSVVLNGSLNPNGNAATDYFQYGTTTSYGSTTTAESTNNGGTVISETVPIDGLVAGTTYHYRLVASNTNGTSYGADQTFTTLTPPPSPPPPPKPEAGTYRGKTSQHDPISIKVAANHAQVSGMTINFGLRCTRRHRRVTYVITPKGSYYWPRRITADGGLGFSDSFLDANNWRYKFKATFTTTGRVTGTMSVTAKHQRYGTCTSGTVRWSATI
jgi:secreted trypsin-like serine protease